MVGANRPCSLHMTWHDVVLAFISRFREYSTRPHFLSDAALHFYLIFEAFEAFPVLLPLDFARPLLQVTWTSSPCNVMRVLPGREQASPTSLPLSLCSSSLWVRPEFSWPEITYRIGVSTVISDISLVTYRKPSPKKPSRWVANSSLEATGRWTGTRPRSTRSSTSSRPVPSIPTLVR